MFYTCGEKRPIIDMAAYTAPGARIVGDVELRKNSSVWFNAVLRGDNEKIRIGEGSNIQDGCVIHTDPGFGVEIGADVVVGHRAVIHGCTIKDRSLIGMSSTILNGAVIGPESFVAAGSLVKEGQVVEPGTLFAGVPARRVRELTAEERAKLKAGAEHYVQSAKHFAETLEPLD